MDSFASDDASKIFHFHFDGVAQPLKAFLLERYQYGREAHWRDTFYPERVRLNGAAVAEDTWVRPGDEVAYRHLRAEEPPAPVALPVLYEDEWLVAIHKPDSVPVSPSGLYYFTSLALLARERFGNPELTPIHRLDLETSGVLLLARRRTDLAKFNALFVEHRIAKRYLALVLGAYPPERTVIEGRLGPHPASAILTKLWLAADGVPNTLTRVLDVVPHVLANGLSDDLVNGAANGAPHREITELALEPVTGKTNQLRVHLAHAGHPIVGDKKYFPDERVFLDWLATRDDAAVRAKLGLTRQALQCQRLAFAHPFTGEPITIEALAESWRAKVADVLLEPKLG
jgi:23S rRNA pseudouridine1911/1915/1917 synthase